MIPRYRIPSMTEMEAADDAGSERRPHTPPTSYSLGSGGGGDSSQRRRSTKRYARRSTDATAVSKVSTDATGVSKLAQLSSVSGSEGDLASNLGRRPVRSAGAGGQTTTAPSPSTRPPTHHTNDSGEKAGPQFLHQERRGGSAGRVPSGSSSKHPFAAMAEDAAGDGGATTQPRLDDYRVHPVPSQADQPLDASQGSNFQGSNFLLDTPGGALSQFQHPRYSPAPMSVGGRSQHTISPTQRQWLATQLRKGSFMSAVSRSPLWPQVEKGRLREFLFALFDDPRSSRAAQWMSMFIMFMIVVSSSAFCISTLKSFRIDDELGKETLAQDVFWWIEVVAVAVFTVEYVTRLLAVTGVSDLPDLYIPEADDVADPDDGSGSPPPPPSATSKMWRFAKQPLNVIDLLAILPFYIELAFGSMAVSLTVFRTLRLARVFRIFKLGRYSWGMQMMGRIVRSSADALWLLVFYMMLGVVVFGTLVFFFEAGEWDEEQQAFLRLGVFGTQKEVSPFTSIPVAFWWATTTVMTVGYGDVVPTSIMGRLVGVVVMLSGVLVLALPITIISLNGTREYVVYQRKQRAAAAVKDALKRQKDLHSTLGSGDALPTDVAMNVVGPYVKDLFPEVRSAGSRRNLYARRATVPANNKVTPIDTSPIGTLSSSRPQVRSFAGSGRVPSLSSTPTARSKMDAPDVTPTYASHGRPDDDPLDGFQGSPTGVMDQVETLVEEVAALRAQQDEQRVLMLEMNRQLAMVLTAITRPPADNV